MATVIKIKDFDNFSEHLIDEVRKRPLLWDKNQHHFNRRKIAKEWEYMEALYGMPVKLLKSKWRNIKDTFHREARKMLVPPIETRDKPLIQYYEGQWKHFDNLLFLWNEDRHGKDDNEDEPRDESGLNNIDVNSVMETFKYELTDSDTTDTENNNGYNVQGTSADADNVAIDIPNTNYNENIPDPIGPEAAPKRKKLLINHGKETPAKVRVYDVNDERSIPTIDEDLHFAKSLVPFMRKLNPIRKLIVRNEIHSLLLRELLCNRCKTRGPQPDCRCNL